MPDATISEFNDPRLVAVYDTINAYDPGTQPDFYAALAARIGAHTVVEIGCGTGMVVRRFAAQGYRCIGVEPSAAMLETARSRPGAQHIEYVHGGATDLDALAPLDADLVFMSGHVAQFFLTDTEWDDALAAMHRALRLGGTLAFESRNPADRAWDRWTPDARSTSTHPDLGPVTHWSHSLAMTDGVCQYENHYVFDATGEHLVSPAALRFRTRAELVGSLTNAGFAIAEVLGNWDGQPAADDSAEFIVVATTMRQRQRVL